MITAKNCFKEDKLEEEDESRVEEFVQTNTE